MHSKDADLISNICGFYEMFKNRSFGCALDASFHDNYLWSVECVRSPLLLFIYFVKIYLFCHNIVLSYYFCWLNIKIFHV